VSTPHPFPDLHGAATGVGSLPGTDAREAARTSTGALEHLPFLPELPARGPGADMIGRSAGLLVELFAQTEPSGWRFADRPGRDTRRAHSWLGEDLDALEEFTQGHQGALKVQAVGPWTLAASIELKHGEKALADRGACRDIAGSLTEGLRRHLAEVRKAGSVQGVRTLWRRLGFAPELLGRRVLVTPTCGLAGASPAYARKALLLAARAAQSLVDNPE
jgi:hypothetical protein